MCLTESRPLRRWLGPRPAWPNVPMRRRIATSCTPTGARRLRRAAPQSATHAPHPARSQDGHNVRRVQTPAGAVDHRDRCGWWSGWSGWSEWSGGGECRASGSAVAAVSAPGSGSRAHAILASGCTVTPQAGARVETTCRPRRRGAWPWGMRRSGRSGRRSRTLTDSVLSVRSTRTRSAVSAWTQRSSVNGGSATLPPGSPSWCSCWPRLATAPRTRSDPRHARSADYHWASVHGCGQAEAGTLRVMSRFRQSRFEAACSSRTSLTVTGMVMTASCKDAR
jgi:hypothetical protein